MGAPMSPERGRSNTRSSSMDGLPDEAIPAVERAISDLVDRRVPIAVVWEAFCVDLEELGIEPPLRCSFNRWAHRISDGDFTAVQICGSSGDLSPRSSRLLVRVMLVQADRLQSIARDLRRSARVIASVLPADGVGPA